MCSCAVYTRHGNYGEDIDHNP